MDLIRRATLDDIKALAPTIREADRLEVESISGLSPEEALTIGVLHSDVPLAGCTASGEVLALFGVQSVLTSPKVGLIWLLASAKIESNKLFFLRHSKPALEALQNEYDVLGNVVDERNELHIKWLKWLGFKFLRRIPEFGVKKIPVLEFVRCKSCVTPQF